MDNNTKTSKHPDWATKFRTPGTELRLIRGKYYLYQYKTIYDPLKKRPKKISGKLIGRITQELGLIESSKNLLRKQLQQKEQLKIGATKEFGLSKFILDRFHSFTNHLQEVFADSWQYILLVAYCRLVYQAPIKNMPHLINQSWLSQQYEIDPITDKHITATLKEVGQNREKQLNICKPSWERKLIF